jgi:hypothetical protein
LKFRIAKNNLTFTTGEEYLSRTLGVSYGDLGLLGFSSDFLLGGFPSVSQSKKGAVWFQIVGVVLFLLLLAAIPIFAQAPTATIGGVVKDATGGTVAGANVTATNVDTGVARTQPTGDDGAYRFPALPVGNYEVQVMKDGFQTFDRKGLTLLVGQDVNVDVQLQVGSTGQTVTVTEEAPQVNTTNATTGGIVDEQQVADLPLNGRNLVDLTLLQAGVVQSNVFSMTNALGATNIVGTTFSANGAPIHSNNFLLDGAIMTGQLSMNNASITGSTMGVDGVKEYKVVSSLPPAEYGQVMGATSATVSKSGTNQFHGDAFDYLRNSAMDARNFFDVLDIQNFYGFGTDKSSVFPGKRLPPYQRNNYGGAFGGPIKKDKTFFWAVYEGLSQNMGITVATNTLPGACYDQTVGDATYHQVTPTSFANAGCSGVAAANQVNAAMQYVDGNIFPGQTGVGFYPYPDANVCPAPAGCVTNGTASTLPGTRLAGATFNYSYPYLQPSHENYGQMRIDQNFSPSDNLFIRYTQDDADQIAGGSYAQERTFESSQYTFITLSENHTFSPTVLNTLRYSLERTVSNADLTSAPNIPSQFLLSPQASDGEGFQVFGSIGPGTVGGIAVTSYSASSGGYGLYIQDIYSYSDDLYWTKGKHGFKFGAILNQYQLSQNQVFQQGGSATFSNGANFAQGIYSGITTTGGTQFPLQQRNYRYSDLGFYAQDDWRASSKLTLNLGLRYEFATDPRELNGLDYNIPNIAAAVVTYPNYGAVPDRMFAKSPFLHDFSPRIGFAYDPFGKGTTAIRGGAGIYYDIGGYGGAMLYEDAAQSPTAYSILITTSSTLASLPFTFAVPLPSAPSVQGGSSFYGPGDTGTASPAQIVADGALPAPRNVDYHLKAPSMLEYNLTVDRQLPWAIGLSVGYVGSRGIHLPTDVEGNPTQPLGYLPNGLPFYCEAAVNPATDPTCTGATTAGSPYFLSRLNTAFGSIVQYTDRSQSWYNSLQVNVTKRVTHGLSFGEAMTWSKLLDNGQAEQPAESNSLREQTLLNPSDDIGRSGYNATFNNRFNLIYHAPTVTSDKMYMKPLNGWWFSGVLSNQTGYPFEPTLNGARDFSHDAEDVDRPDLGSSFNPSTVITGTPTQWFNPTMFAIPAVGTAGNAPRNGLDAPGLFNLDVSAVKDTRVKWLGEQGNIEFRAEVFNILNRANFGLPNATVWSPGSPGEEAYFNGVYNPQLQAAGTIDPASIGSGTSCAAAAYGVKCAAAGTVANTAAFGSAGQITSTNTHSRQIQLALKIIF